MNNNGGEDTNRGHCGHPELYDNTSSLNTGQTVSEKTLPGKFWNYFSAQQSSDRSELHSAFYKLFACRLADRPEEACIQAFYKA